MTESSRRRRSRTLSQCSHIGSKDNAYLTVQYTFIIEDKAKFAVEKSCFYLRIEDSFFHKKNSYLDVLEV